MTRLDMLQNMAAKLDLMTNLDLERWGVDRTRHASMHYVQLDRMGMGMQSAPEDRLVMAVSWVVVLVRMTVGGEG